MKAAAAFLALAALTTSALATDSTRPAYGGWGFDLASVDNTVKPGDDFFLYANGNWLKRAVIPPDRVGTGSFQDLIVLSEQRMKKMAAELDARPYDQRSSEEKQRRDLYDSFTDTQAI